MFADLWGRILHDKRTRGDTESRLKGHMCRPTFAPSFLLLFSTAFLLWLRVWESKLSIPEFIQQFIHDIKKLDEISSAKSGLPHRPDTIQKASISKVKNISKSICTVSTSRPFRHRVREIYLEILVPSADRPAIPNRLFSWIILSNKWRPSLWAMYHLR